MSPLTHFHCPDNPMAWRKIEDCRKCDHVCFGSLPWVEVVWAENFNDDEHYHSNPLVISVTEVIGCLRQAWYKRTRDYAESPERLLARVMGTHIHRLPEKHSPEGAEHQVFTPLSRGYSFGGTMDKLLDNEIVDYKTTDRPTKTLGGAVRLTEDGGKVHLHSDQLSIYADLKEMGEDAKLTIVQVSRRSIATHEAYRVPGALDRALDRAELLIDAIECDETFLEREGVEIKFYRAKMCDFCAFKEECLK